jgi:hypothetical protein
LIIARTEFEYQPSDTSVFGNSTLIADLTQYRSQILAIVPEPSSYVLGLAGLAAMAWMGKRSRRASP